MAFVYQSKAATIDPGLNEVTTQFQVTDCEGTEVGDPIAVLQTVVMNKILANICNTDDIVGTYNRPERTVLSAAGNVTLATGTYHSVSYKVISGSATISINGGAAQTLDAGEADEITASRVIDVPIVITWVSGKIVVLTIKEA